MKLILAFFILLINNFSFSQENANGISIKEAINQTLKNNLEIKAEEYKKQIALTDLDLIKGETSTKINLTAGVGPINEKKGNYLSYTDEKNWGAEWITGIEMKIPLYIWGREKNLKKAVTINGEINQLDVLKKQNEVIYKLKEAYYGEQYAMSLLEFVSETEKDLNDAVAAIEEKKGKKEDLLKLEVFKYQVQEKKIEIEKSIKLARMGLKFYTGNENFVNSRNWIEFEERELKDVLVYRDTLLKNYPDLQKINMGLEAKNNLLESEKKSAYPAFGALVKYDYAHTDMRTAQKNPFIVDNYNHNDVAVGVGLTWDIDFGVKKSKQDKIVFEIAELNSKNHFAKAGLEALLNKAYFEVEATEKKAKTLQKAYKSSKKWLSNIETSVGLGLTPAKDIIDAYTTRALVYKDYYEAIYNNHLAWANLSMQIGTEVDPLLTTELKN
jgi:outer membrane protein TolC